MKKKRKLRKWPFIYLLQIVSSMVLAFFVYQLNMLPLKYFAAFIGILVLLLLITLLMMKPEKDKKRWIRTSGKLVSLLLSIVLLIGSLAVSKGNAAMNDLISSNTMTVKYAVLVKKDSSYESLADLKDETINYTLAYDSEEDMKKVIKEAKKENNDLSFSKEESHENLGTDLIEGDVEAILVNKAYNGNFEEQYESFNSDVKEIWSYEIKIEVEDISKDVDVTKKPFTVYITGIDTDGPVDTIARSDVNMIVTINPQTHQILMTSIPRDYFVEMADSGEKDKLTHSGLTGVNNTIKTVENFMGIDINYYVRVNFTSLRTIVDALGGIEVYSDKEFDCWANRGIHIEKGMQHMDGETALSFARERKAYASGDLHRTQNQQTVLTAMIHKACSPQIIASYSDLLNAVQGCFETNLSNDEISSLVKFQLNHMKSWEIIHTHLNGEGKTMRGGALMPNTRLWYTMPNEEAVEMTSQLINDMLSRNKVDKELVEKIEKKALE